MSINMPPSKRTLAQIADSFPGADYGTKPARLWSIYEEYVATLSDRPLRILELGIWKGFSLQVLATYFRNSAVVGIDIELPVLDNPPRNVIMVRGSQVDESVLSRTSEHLAPEGWDIIIDDASHSGLFSLQSFDALFPRLKPGGLYFVEDWASAYMPEWGDGAALEVPRLYEPNQNGFAKRIASHDWGMAGFVKVLVDRSHYPASIFEWLTFHDMMVVAKKL